MSMWMFSLTESNSNGVEFLMASLIVFPCEWLTFTVWKTELIRWLKEYLWFTCQSRLMLIYGWLIHSPITHHYHLPLQPSFRSWFSSRVSIPFLSSSCEDELLKGTSSSILLSSSLTIPGWFRVNECFDDGHSSKSGRRDFSGDIRIEDRTGRRLQSQWRLYSLFSQLTVTSESRMGRISSFLCDDSVVSSASVWALKNEFIYSFDGKDN